MSEPEPVNEGKRQMLKGILDAIQQSDSDRVAAAALGAKPIDQMVEDLPDEKKREMVSNILTVLAGAGLMLTLTPKEAHAELQFRDVRGAVEQALRNVLGDLIDVLMDAFGANLGFAIPVSVVQMIEALLEWLAATDETVITDDPTEPLERSWPEVPPVPDADKRESAMFTAAATRARTIQSSGMFNAVSRQQATMTAEETLILDAATVDPSVLTKLNANNALMASACSRLGSIAMAIAAHGQLTAHDTIRSSHEVESQQQLIERFLTTLEEVISSAPSRQSTSIG